MSLATYAPSLNYTPTKPSSVLFQGDVPPSVQRQIVEFSDFHLKGVDFARTTGSDSPSRKRRRKLGARNARG